MAATTFTELLDHVGHDMECVSYGDPDDPANVALECTTCGAVLLDFDAEDDQEWWKDGPSGSPDEPYHHDLDR